MKNVFNKADVQELIARIEKLTPQTQAIWGKMTVAQMLAHCNISYELVYEEKHARPNAFARLILKTFVKKIVVNEVPYKHNSRTGPQFLVTEEKNFALEKNRLISHLEKTQELGETFFHNKESNSFGKLSKAEWNNMFYKHLDHHLSQFGV
jgi:hypothetical protein